MTEYDYAVCSQSDWDWESTGSNVSRALLTEYLGCTDVAVTAYDLAGESVSLSVDREWLCMAIDGQATLTDDEPRPLTGTSIGFVPAGIRGSIGAAHHATVIVIGAVAPESSLADPVVVDPNNLRFDSLTPTGSLERLTARLECRGMKANLRILEPGEAIPYHTEGRQEELFLPLDGPGTLRVGGDSRTVPERGLARVSPALGRGAINDGDEGRLWLMIGAPATGDADEWAPGVELVEWPDGA